jgi:hypothetical protein
MSNAISDPIADGRAFADIGVRPANEDLGSGPILGAGAFDARFKTAQLRNVELTAPYFHNGKFATLEQVVDFYNRGGDFNNPNHDGQVRQLNLTLQEQADLVAFLKSLTDERVRFQSAPFDHPSLCIPDGHPGNELGVTESFPGSGEAADSLRCMAAVGAGGSALPIRTFPPQPVFGDAAFGANFIEELAASGITAGCGAGNYCPDVPLTRAQMAVFIETALGNPPNTCGGTVFTDVTAASVGDAFCGFIEKLAADGITGGCGNGNFCPDSPVSRGEMAVFIEAAAGKQGGACGGRFGDVDPLSPFCGFIERLNDDGISGGCGAGNFCPNDPVTRAQMAVFIASAFLF